jgi:hypothetical protein
MICSFKEVVETVFSTHSFTLRSPSSSALVCGEAKNTISFQALSSFYDDVRRAASNASTAVEVLFATDGPSLVITVRIGKKRGRESGSELDATAKVSDDDLRDHVKAAFDKLSKKEGDLLSKESLSSAQTVCDSLVCSLKSVDAAGERAVQSFGAFYKKLSPSDSKPRVVLGFRLHAGMPMRVSDLKSCLALCWADGAITTEETLHSVDAMNLPLTPEGVLSRQHGNLPLLVVTSVTT